MLAIPAICAQLVTLLYNLVDYIFIGQMEDGMLAMAAIGICTPVITIITAFSILNNLFFQRPSDTGDEGLSLFIFAILYLSDKSFINLFNFSLVKNLIPC